MSAEAYQAKLNVATVRFSANLVRRQNGFDSELDRSYYLLSRF